MAQGLTLKKVGMYLKTPVFAHGQLYVALSRVSSAKSIKICTERTDKTQMTPNVVYKDIIYD